MIELTEKQKAVLDYIVSYRSEKGVSPTFTEMACFFDCAQNTVYGHVKALIKKGALVDPRGRSRMLVPDENAESISA